ncbi:MAG: polymer-forming cytoskeletal protein [Bacteroidales bacterium]|nr:polymer-forming cytoskeletal protein [Bacteroidales bacterium]
MAREFEFEGPKPGTENVVQTGTTITGNVDTNSDIRIDGIVKGSINAAGKVTVGKNGYIEGDINCGSAIIEGKCKVAIRVKELLEMKSTAVFEGEISTSKLYIETGAIFEGTCKMKLDDKGAFKPQPQPTVQPQPEKKL